MTYEVQPNQTVIDQYANTVRAANAQSRDLMIWGDSRAHSLAVNHPDFFAGLLRYEPGRVFNYSAPGTTLREQSWLAQNKLASAPGGAARLASVKTCIIQSGIVGVYGTSDTATAIKSHMAEVVSTLASLVLSSCKFYVVQVYKTTYDATKRASYSDTKLADLNTALAAETTAWTFVPIYGEDPTDTMHFYDQLHMTKAGEQRFVIPAVQAIAA